MNPSTQHNIGAYAVAVTGVFPQVGNANVVGVSIDRAAHFLPLSCVLHQLIGAVTGAPATTSVITKLQHSADNINFVDYIPNGATSVAATPALAAGNTENALAIGLGGANRWLRLVTQVAFTGGNAPAVLVAADLILGGEGRNQAI